MSDTQPNEKVTVLGSDGIHTRIHRQPLNPDGTKKDWDGPPENPFWGHIEDLMADSRQILLAGNFPDPDQVVKFVVGLGWMPQDQVPKTDTERRLLLVADKDPIEGKQIWEELGRPNHGRTLGDRFAMIAADPYSEEWYAGQIHFLCNFINHSRENTYEGHLVRIYQIAEFEKEREWRRDFGLMIKRELKAQKGRKDGGHIRKVQTAKTTAEILTAMKQMQAKGLTASRSAELAFKKGLGKSKGANQQLWTRHKDKL